MAVPSAKELEDAEATLAQDGYDVVRVGYCDVIGTERGRDVLVNGFARTVEDGVAFCRSVYATTPTGDTVPIKGGLDDGLPDVIAFPDLSTIKPLPWEPGVAHCIADVYDPDGTPSPAEPSKRSQARCRAFRDLDMSPIVGPELEFYVLERDDQAPTGWRRYGEATGNVYVAGRRGDPDNVLLRSLRQLGGYGLDVVTANHEYSSGQFEINLWHSEALDAADRAFRFKSAVKELARQEGKLATFMGKPFNDEGGSGFHIHFSTWTDDGVPIFDDPDDDARTVQHGPVGHRRGTRPRPRSGRDPQPDDQLLQAARARHVRALARRLGPGQPQRNDPHSTRARPRVADGVPPR